MRTASEEFSSKMASFDESLSAAEMLISSLDRRVLNFEQTDADLDAQHPWRKYERDCDAQEWASGWQRIKVDNDWLANVADQMDDPAMCNAMAAVLSNPSNPEAHKLKAAVSLRNAPNTSWVSMCPSAYGGSSAKTRAHIFGKVACADCTVS